MSDDDLITVCDQCLRASCWQDFFLCDANWNDRPGTKQMRRDELVRLGREHPSYLKTDSELSDE